MDAASAGARSTARPVVRSRRLLSLVADERLVEHIRRGNEAAFEVVFERYASGLVAFCRHMLSSREEAEDAVQLTFAAAYSDLLRRSDRVINLKPWLFTIARNRCLSILRARREPPSELGELPTSGVGEQVEERVELRELLADLRELPHEQRAALLLAEISDMSHAQIAVVLDCEAPRVKALVFRARSALMDRRRARETPCAEIQEQLANLSGGSLRRTPVRLHLRECAACRDYRDEVRNQRKVLAAALPVAPSLGLKSSVLAALGIGGGSAGGGLAVGLSSVAGAFGGGALAKVAVIAALAGGAAIAVPDALESRREAHTPDSGAESHSSRRATPGSQASVQEFRETPRLQPLSTPGAARAGTERPRAGAGTHGPAASAGSPRRTPKPGASSGPANAVKGKVTPPGQARKADNSLPPGQAKKADNGAAPPGHAKLGGDGPPGKAANGAKGANSANRPKPEPPGRPASKVQDQGPAAPAAPAAGNSVPAQPPVEKPKHATKP
jgi:RNA polymerase sigma factor (sigma-70 family)